MSNNVSAKNSHPHNAVSPTGDPAVNHNGTDDNTPTPGGRDDTPRFVAPTHGGVDILKLLTELEDLVEHTRRGPMGIMLGFPEDQFHMTVMKIRANLPEEMKRASKLAREQERIVEETRQDAERIKVEARKAAVAEFERGSTELARQKEQAIAEARRLQAEAMAESERSRARAEEEAERLLSEAKAMGRDIVEEARSRAAQLVTEHEIVQRAQVEAQEICRNAEGEAENVRCGADDYARTVLVNLETVLGKAVTQVQHGRELLERTQQA